MTENPMGYQILMNVVTFFFTEGLFIAFYLAVAKFGFWVIQTLVFNLFHKFNR